MSPLHSRSSSTMEVCRSHLLTSSPLPAALDSSPIHGEYHENITCNGCIGDAAEFVCSRSIRRRAGRLRPGPTECRVSLLPLTVCVRLGSTRTQPAELAAPL